MLKNKRLSDALLGIVILGLLLHLRHKVEEVAAPDHLDVLFGEVLLQELARELYELGSVAESADAAVSFTDGSASCAQAPGTTSNRATMIGTILFICLYFINSFSR